MSKHQERLLKEAAFFDAIAEKIEINGDLLQRLQNYDSPAGDSANRLPRLKSRLYQLLGDLTDSHVLVYGCGFDNAAIWFAKAGANVDAIDISPKSIENQKLIAAKTGVNINALLMDAHRLEFPSNRYDIVYGNLILHHLEIEKAAGEIHRVLKPGGKGVFRDVMKGNLFLQVFRFLTPFWRTPDEHPLTNNDFAFLNKKFLKCEIDQYILSGLPYLFLARIMNNVIFRRMRLKVRIPRPDSIYANMDKIDCLLFRLMPFLKKQAWYCLIALTK